MTSSLPGSPHGLGPAFAPAGEAFHALVGGAGTRVGFLLDGAGMVVAASGIPGTIDEPTFASLASSHLAAAEQLASLLGAADFGGLQQEGKESTVALARVGAEWSVAVIVDHPQGAVGGSEGWREGMRLLESTLERFASDEGGGEGMGREWMQEAENEIDRLFREELS